MFKVISISLALVLLLTVNSISSIIKQINVNGNVRVADETIKMFSGVKINDDINSNQLNDILKKIYNSNYFKNVSVDLKNNLLIINVEEYPLIQNISYNGIKANKIKEPVLKNLSLKSRSAFDEFLLKKDKELILSRLKDFGYYFAEIDIVVETLEDNTVNLTYDINLGSKVKIKKIKFLGDKIFKDSKLRNVIISEEYKFWKIISGKKYLNENIIKLDQRLLTNFYLNKGYYNAKVNTSFAKLVDKDSFELIYNIDANKKFTFDKLNLILPPDYDRQNFAKLENLLKGLNGKNYSLNSIEQILDEINLITLNEQYSSIKASYREDIANDKINIDFIIEDAEKYFVEKINIFGNNVTLENVIRNQFEIDEGDPFNEILQKRTVNNLKGLSIFKDVRSEVLDSKNLNNKIINISVEEKPTGEISAGAGVGTSGSSVSFGVKENNFLGKGIKLNSNLSVSGDSLKGIVAIENPNLNNSDKSISFSLESAEYDNLKKFGYKTNKNGFSIGTDFEYYDDLYLGLQTRNYIEKISTNSTASVRQKAQAGNYFDSFLDLSFNYDKRNQVFETSDGFKSYYSIQLPIISDTNTLTNTYNYDFYTELYDQNLSSISFYFKNGFSLSDDDIKLSERLFIPSKKLRGFEAGKVGPKDGSDFVGGNNVLAINFSSTIPKILENSENTNFLLFMDVANIWGVDYDDAITDSGDIRSSIGIGVDWFTVIGPLNFSLAHPISKNTNDKTETFRFDLGTTF